MSHNIIMVSILAGTICATFASEKKVKPELQQVRIFPDGCIMQYESWVELDPGTHKIIITNVPLPANNEFPIVQVSDGAKLISATMQTSYIQHDKSKNDSTKYYHFTLDSLHNQLLFLEAEKSTLLQHRDLSHSSNYKTNELEDLLDLYRERLPKIQAAIYHTKLLKDKIELNQVLFESRNCEYLTNQSSKNLEISLLCTEKKQVKITFDILSTLIKWHHKSIIQIHDKLDSCTIRNTAFLINNGLSLQKAKITLEYSPLNRGMITYKTNDTLSKTPVNKGFNGPFKTNIIDNEYNFKEPISLEGLITSTCGESPKQLHLSEQKVSVKMINKSSYPYGSQPWKCIVLATNTLKNFSYLNYQVHYKYENIMTSIGTTMSIDSLVIPIVTNTQLHVDNKVTKKLLNDKTLWTQSYELSNRSGQRQILQLHFSLPLSQHESLEWVQLPDSKYIETLDNKGINFWTALEPNESRSIHVQYIVKSEKDSFIYEKVNNKR